MALVQYAGKNVFGVLLKAGSIFRFMPGINEVAEAVLSELKEHPLFLSRINKNIIQIMHEKVEADGKISISEMLKNIPNIFDTRLLNKIINTDGRKAVVIAAKAQLDTIKTPLKKEEEKEKDDHFS